MSDSKIKIVYIYWPQQFFTSPTSNMQQSKKSTHIQIFFSGLDSVEAKLDKVFQHLEAQKVSTTSISIEEFLLIFQLLAFFACAGKAPIRQKMLDESLARVRKAGDPENILRWCFWTKDQHTLMAMADKLPRVILIGGNGTGKT